MSDESNVSFVDATCLHEIDFLNGQFAEHFLLRETRNRSQRRTFGASPLVAGARVSEVYRLFRRGLAARRGLTVWSAADFLGDPPVNWSLAHVSNSRSPDPTRVDDGWIRNLPCESNPV